MVARERHFGRALGLSLMAALAALYSLTAELSLIAGARGDRAAERAEKIVEAKNSRAQRDRVEAELATLSGASRALGTVRPAGTIRAEIASFLSDARVGDCTIIDGPRSRSACPEVSKLKAELGLAERREKLEEALRAFPARETAVGAGVSNGAVKAADPGASALATYLTALGFKVSPQAVGEWLVLVPVLALELGSALAGLLVGAVSPAAHPALNGLHGRREAAPATAEPGIETRSVDTLRERGGLPNASVRGIAALIGSRNVRGVSIASATLLIVASAGLGCTFAWHSGSAHGSLIGALSVAMALGLELAKPLAVTGALAAAPTSMLSALPLTALAVSHASPGAACGRAAVSRHGSLGFCSM